MEVSFRFQSHFDSSQDFDSPLAFGFFMHVSLKMPGAYSVLIVSMCVCYYIICGPIRLRLRFL